MIDPVIRSKGIGGSEIAAILGLDPRRDAFAVYADKLGLVQRDPPSARMRAGKFFEQAIAKWYGEDRQLCVQWFDQTVAPRPERPWQVITPDAFAYGPADKPAEEPTNGLDAKKVAWDQAWRWGEPGSDQVPQEIALQCEWYCSATGLPYWDIPMVTDVLRVYRVHHDPAIEAVMLEEAERFWRDHVLAHVAPKPGPSPATTEALKKMYPRQVENLRCATAEEVPLIAQLRDAKIAYKVAKQAKDAAENSIKAAIGDAEGLLNGKEKITWKLCKDTMGTRWESVARAACPDEQRLAEFVAANQGVTRAGSRRLYCPRDWGSDDE